MYFFIESFVFVCCVLNRTWDCSPCFVTLVSQWRDSTEVQYGATSFDLTELLIDELYILEDIYHKLPQDAIHQIFIFFTKWQPFKNYEKCFLFHLKSSFCSWDIQFCVISVLPSFSTCQSLLWRMIKDKSLRSWCHQLSK